MCFMLCVNFLIWDMEWVWSFLFGLCFIYALTSTDNNKQNSSSGKLQLTHLWFGWNLSCLLVVWNLKLYPLEVWSKFKLLTCGLKSHDIGVLLNSFLSYLILYFYVFCVFWGERHKSGAILHICPVFNINRL